MAILSERKIDVRVGFIDAYRVELIDGQLDTVHFGFWEVDIEDVNSRIAAERARDRRLQDAHSDEEMLRATLDDQVYRLSTPIPPRRIFDSGWHMDRNLDGPGEYSVRHAGGERPESPLYQVLSDPEMQDLRVQLDALWTRLAAGDYTATETTDYELSDRDPNSTEAGEFGPEDIPF